MIQQIHLKVTRDEAKELCMAQVEQGENLLDEINSIQSEEQLDNARYSYKDWRDCTKHLLRDTLFDTLKLFNEFMAPVAADERRLVDVWRVLGDLLSVQQRRAYLASDLNRDLHQLRSIYRRLELFPVRLPQSLPTEAGAGDILPTELKMGGKYGTCRDLTVADVRAIVKKCLAFQKRGGKVPDFYDQLNLDSKAPRHFALETLRGWLKNPKFAPQEDT